MAKRRATIAMTIPGFAGPASFRGTAAGAKRLAKALASTGQRAGDGYRATTSIVRSAPIPGGEGRRFGFTIRKLK
jgi:hypothetical protein